MAFFDTVSPLGTAAIHTSGGVTLGLCSSALSGPCTPGTPARILHSNSATPRSCTLLEASAQLVATPVCLLTIIMRML
jgi:hypothetical protein